MPVLGSFPQQVCLWATQEEKNCIYSRKLPDRILILVEMAVITYVFNDSDEDELQEPHSIPGLGDYMDDSLDQEPVFNPKYYYIQYYYHLFM